MIENGGYFAADVSKANRYRDELSSTPWEVDKQGNVWPIGKPGPELEVDEKFLQKLPAGAGLRLG